MPLMMGNFFAFAERQAGRKTTADTVSLKHA